MKEKSLRQLARELGVSASYLSQVKHGKRAQAKKLLSNLLGYKSDKEALTFNQGVVSSIPTRLIS